MRRFAPTGLVIALLAVAGCGVHVPSDPDGTLAEIRGGTLRVGVSLEPGLTASAGEDVSGPLVTLATEFADEIDAEPTWVVSSEESLLRMLQEQELDLLIGGFTVDTPWTDRAGMTRGYTDIVGADGRELVFLVPLGANDYLMTLESFLDAEMAP